MFGHAVYLAILAFLMLWVSGSDLAQAREAWVVIGLVGAWRYSWAALNFARAALYCRRDYPRLRAHSEAAYEERDRPARAFFLVTSYRIPQEVTAKVYRSVFRAALASKGGAEVVASVVSPEDAHLIKALHAQICVGSGVALTVDRLQGTGKRDALAAGLRKITKRHPTPEDIVLLVDGDSCVPEDIVARSAPFFTNPRVGALTTNEVAKIARPGLFEDWFNLRFDQRQVMMCSMGLSRRVLTLTGRMSVFRADLATHGEFIRAVENDYIDHWRLGRLRFLTGDDKSTWFWLLRYGYQMLYLPDVQSVSLESQPKAYFGPSAITLMVRWFGNMLRTNGRALALSRRQIGPFAWWSLLDQRMSIWTTLIGPTAAILAGLLYDPMIFIAYGLWVMLTRYVFCAAIAGFNGKGFRATYPGLLYFSQLGGALVKSYVSFRLDRQKWTRQDGGFAQDRSFARQFASAYLHTLAVGWLVFCVFFVVGAGGVAL